MNELVDHVNGKDALPSILETFELHAPRYSHLVLRTFELKVNSEWRSAGWSLSACVAGDLKPSAAVAYQDTRMRCEARPVAEFRQLLEDPWLRQQVVGVPAVDISNTSVAVRVVSFSNASGPRPGRQWDISQNTNNLFSWSRRLVGFSQPFQVSSIRAFGSWFNMPNLRSGSDGQVGRATVYLPETRAWISSVSRTDDRLRVFVERDASYSSLLCLKGRVGPHGFEEAFDFPVTAEPIGVPLPLGTNSVELLLVAEDDSILSWHSETSESVNGLHRVLGAEPLGGEAAQVEKLIRLGECDTIEFKTFIDPEHEKYNDLLRVICSFANTRGGTLLIGVEDDTSITGVEGGLCRWAKKSFDLALKDYERLLVKRIGEHIDPRPSIRFATVTLMDHSVIAVHVDVANRKPLTFDGPIYLRFAGTTRQALGTEIQTMFGPVAAPSEADAPWHSE